MAELDQVDIVSCRWAPAKVAVNAHNSGPLARKRRGSIAFQSIDSDSSLVDLFSCLGHSSVNRTEGALAQVVLCSAGQLRVGGRSMTDCNSRPVFTADNVYDRA